MYKFKKILKIKNFLGQRHKIFFILQSAPLLHTLVTRLAHGADKLPNKPDISAEESELFPYKREILLPNWDKCFKVKRSEDLSSNKDKDIVMIINNMSITNKPMFLSIQLKVIL